MVVIRLSRGGAKKKPFYRIVATDKRNRRDGRYIEQLGYFNPVAKGQETKLHMDMALVDKWLKNGAQASDTVQNLIKTYAKSVAVTDTKTTEKVATTTTVKKTAASAKKKATTSAKVAKPSTKTKKTTKAATEKATDSN